VLIQGHDTTTSAITFTLFNLAKYQEIQQRVFAECEEILGNNSSHTMHELNQLNYLEKVIKETLRLYPSVPNYSRKFLEEETINGWTFPPEVSIRVSAYLMGRDPKYFPDPLKFDPSRFDSEENNIRLFSYVPFSAGPR
jgi:cytochrome P450 family 4